MLDTLYAFFGSAGFIFVAGLLLLVAFFWYLSSENDRTKLTAGSMFIIGICAFSLISLLKNSINYGIDIAGGVELTLQVQSKEGEGERRTEPTETEMQQACDILNERLNSSGTAEVQIIYSGNKILIQIPQQDKDEAKNREKMDGLVKMLTKMAKLELLAVHPESSSIIRNADMVAAIERYEEALHKYTDARKENPQTTHRAPALPRIPASLMREHSDLLNYRVLPNPLTDDDTGAPVLDENGYQVNDYLVLQNAATARQKDVYIEGKDVAQAYPDYSRPGYAVVNLTSDAASRMRKLTGSMRKGQDRLAVVLNDTVKSAPVVQDNLGKEFTISGLNGPGEAEDICKALANPLSSDLLVEGRKDVSAQLGKSALTQGQIAGLVGLVLIFLFCYWYYRSAGIVAMVGLTLNALILLGLMSLFGFVLTLPGIAGIVLTMGVAVDANVLIYERMREEQKLGRGFVQSLRNAYDKAFSAIFDSNVTSLITAVILFWMASGSIKGFAVTTSVGIITTLIGALVVTRVLFFWAERFNLINDTHFHKAPLEGRQFNFMKWRKQAGIASIILIVSCLAYTVFVRGDKALGIDFIGGTSVTYELPSDSKLDYHDVENSVNKMQLSKKPTVQEFGSVTEKNIKIRCASEEEAQQIDTLLRGQFAEMKDITSSTENVSASLGATFFKTACWALLAGLLGITVYLAIRFEWSFALGALVAIGHDILAVIGLVILMGTELSIIHIGAFLTVAGYSINDTIVIYDRIRETLRTAEPNDKLTDIMNEAINNTLSRTLLTGLSTVAVLVALLVLGGPAMRDFSITMLIGVIIGTYSSIYIASPVVLLFARKHDLKAELQRSQEENNAQV